MYGCNMSRSFVEELMLCFKLLDMDGNGTVEASELQRAFQMFGLEVDNTEIQTVLKQHDKCVPPMTTPCSILLVHRGGSVGVRRENACEPRRSKPHDS